MPVPSVPRRAGHSQPSRFLLGWLLFALALRALVPVGYMPDAAALRDGRLALEFCAAAGGLPLSLRGQPAPDAHPAGAHDAAGHAHHLAHHDHDADHGDGQRHGVAGQECPFGLTAHQALDMPPIAAVVAVPQHAPRKPTWDSFNAGPPLPAAGPPLGQRAPPRRYG